jgi:hypothetical protein
LLPKIIEADKCKLKIAKSTAPAECAIIPEKEGKPVHQYQQLHKTDSIKMQKRMVVITKN